MVAKFRRYLASSDPEVPLIPLCVFDWLKWKHHPIREEQTAWRQQNQPHILWASIAGFLDIICRLALRVLDRIEAEITALKRRMDNKDPENEDQRTWRPILHERQLWLYDADLTKFQPKKLSAGFFCRSQVIVLPIHVQKVSQTPLKANLRPN